MPRMGRVRVLVSALVVVLSVAALLAFAMRAPGYPARNVDLNDSGIWVTSNNDALFGRLNKSASSLDAWVGSPGGAQTSASLDVFQDQSAVVARDERTGKLIPVNVSTARVVTDGVVSVSPTAIVDMRNGTLAALYPSTGKIFATRYDPTTAPSLQALADTAKALAQLGTPPASTAAAMAAYSTLAVATDGTIYAADLSGKLATIAATSQGFAKATYRSIPAPKSIELSTVGSHVIALDAVSGTVTVDGGKPLSLGGPDPQARVQQPGPDASSLLVATFKALYAVPLSGGAATTVFGSASGPPAAPVRVGACVYGAWAGSPGQVVKACGSAPAVNLGLDRGRSLARPVFRVNRNQVVVNDEVTGGVFDMDLKRSVDNWQQIQPPKQTKTDQQALKQQVAEDTKQKPRVVADNLGARPGRTVVLHVLDNDTDKSNRVLSIIGVTQPGNSAASVLISPDEQSLIYTLSDAGGDSDFQYRISNGSAEATGDVHVAAHGPGVNGAPYLRAGTAPKLTVPSGGTLPVQVLQDWRDPDGDPVALASVKAPTGTAAMTSDGRIEYTAARNGKGGVQKLAYAVSDGIVSTPTPGSLTVDVQAPDATKGTAAISEPDVARGEVGRSVAINPLANDIPGSDPLNPQAALQLSSDVGAQDGVKVRTDLSSGQIMVTPGRVGAFFLTYSVGFGSAPLATGQIRVDAAAATKDAPVPVAMPDVAVVHGQGSVMVDVLANDVDTAGSVLTVVGAAAASPDQVQVAVVKGRWLRLTPSTATFTSNPQIVHYRVTNGLSAPVAGVVSVTQLPAIENDSIITRPDYATVRAGDSALIPVLDNDAALSGAQLSLQTNVPGASTVGELTVVDPAASNVTAGDLGTAYVSGDAIRYVAPARVTQPKTFQIEYTAQTDTGENATGTLQVTVTPSPDAKSSDRAPTPNPIEARARAGETLTIPVRATGTDPDGDTTSVVGIASAPTLGRVVGFTPTTILYQAYPDAEGTDSFAYTVTDRYGLQSSSLVRVAVVPPGTPQVAVAAPVSITAEPGATVTVYPLVNAYYLKTDPVKLLPLADTNAKVPAGVRLDAASGSIMARAPAADARPLQVSYALTGNAGPGVPSTVTVRGQAGYKNPPQIQDHTATVDGKPTATVDVLKNAYDPDGDSSTLEVSKVDNPLATVSAGSVTVPVTNQPQAIPYQVTDASGAVSAAVIYVPAQGAGGPYVKSGVVIRVPEGQSAIVRLSDYVDDPRSRAVSLTTTDQLWASPAASVDVVAAGKNTLTVTGQKGYIGPGSVVVEVTDGKTLDDPQGIRTVLSILVQVGPETPVVRCPTEPVTVVAGGQALALDITSLCSVWTPTEAMAASLSYTASWSKSINDVTAKAQGRTVTVDAAGTAKPNAIGTVMIGVDGAKATAAPLNVQVVAAPKPTLASIQPLEMKQGDTRTIDLKDYLRSPLKDAVPTAVSIKLVSPQAATGSVSGSTVTITPGATSHGQMAFTVVASDVADRARTDRQVSGSITFQVFGVPEPPGTPQPGSSALSRSASLSWSVPAANGAPIDFYEVSWSGGAQKCAATPCTIKGLNNGTNYTFTVSAHNKAGPGKPSGASAGYTPDEAPQKVPGFMQSAAGDGTVTLSWGAAVTQGTDVSDYVVAVDGRTISAGAVLGTTVSGLTNGQAYVFTIVAKNALKAGPATTTKGYAAGAPKFSGPVTPQGVQPVDADVTAVTVTWAAADSNGPEQATYTLTRTGGGSKEVCTDVSGTSCQDQGVSFGTTYTYSVVAKTVFLNVTRTSTSVSASPYTPVGKPGSWQAITATPTGQNNQIGVTFTAPPSRGTQSTVSVLLNGAISASLGSFPVAGSGPTTAIVSVPANSTTYSLSLQECNETAQCSVSNVVGVNAYGPIPAPTVSIGKTGATTSTWQVSANGNGRQITVHIWTDSGQNNQNPTTVMGGTWSGSSDVGWAPASESVHVTITDSAGRPVPTQLNAGPVASDLKPNPVASISHGGSFTCTLAGATNCLYVYVTLTGWNPSSTVYCFAGGVVAPNWWRHAVVDGSGNLGGFGAGDSGAGILWDSAGSRFPDGSLTASSGMSCTQQ